MATKKPETAKVEKPKSVKAPAKKVVAKLVKPTVKVEKVISSKNVEAKPAEVKAEKIEAQVVEKTGDKITLIIKKLEKPKAYNFKLFNKWDADVVVGDPGLKRYIQLNPILIPFSQGRDVKKQFWKSDKHIVERLILKLMVVGHKGKRQFKDNGHNTGKYVKIANNVIKAFELIEQKTKKNPLEVFVRAVENGAPVEGVTTIEYGGVRYPKAVDLSPQRRIDLVLRWISQGVYHSKGGKGNRKNLPERLSEQIMLTAAGDQASNAVSKRHETERSASASR